MKEFLRHTASIMITVGLVGILLPSPYLLNFVWVIGGIALLLHVNKV